MDQINLNVILCWIEGVRSLWSNSVLHVVFARVRVNLELDCILRTLVQFDCLSGSLEYMVYCQIFGHGTI